MIPFAAWSLQESPDVLSSRRGEDVGVWRNPANQLRTAGVRLFIQENDSGERQIVARFDSGAHQVLATEPAD